MLNPSLNFWLELLTIREDINDRTRLWNGYLGWKLPSRVKQKPDPRHGWPQLFVEPPAGGWPKLTEEEMAGFENLAEAYGGHPKFEHDYMNFSGHRFNRDVDLSGLTIVRSNFRRAQFLGSLKLSHETHIFDQSWFCDTTYRRDIFCDQARFHAPVSFAGSCFNEGATFIGTEFMGGASFANATFQLNAMFNDSKFEERYFSAGISIPILADFRKAKFPAGASFREVQFGNDENAYSRRLWPERRADFTDAEFGEATTFRGAIFAGAPAFFNTTLHEDTDFGQVDWRKAETKNVSVDYAVRAWERLELMMSKLEKPLDRHRFFRLKMRARRRTDGPLLQALNWLFEITCDYGWGVGRAFGWWLGHWFVSALALFASSVLATGNVEWEKLALTALGTSFANAHAFLFLATEGGYLAAGRVLLNKRDEWGMLVPLGTVEAVLGPIFLFLLLLTLRNRFRLA